MSKKSSDKKLEQIVKDFKPGDHICCIYETEEEHQALIRPFLRLGLERGEKVLYIADVRTDEIILDFLRGDGVKVQPYLASGQISFPSGDDTYMRAGVFDPDGMIALLRDETERALNEGYPALRVTGEMTWALRGLTGSERLIEYEAKLNKFFPTSKCLAICQYDRREFQPQLLLDVLLTHPIAVIGKKTFDNFYYMPPQDFIGPDLESAKLGHWLNNLARRNELEETLRKACGDLEARNKEMQSFVYSLSHDLKTPLVSLQGFSSLLQNKVRDQLDQKGKHYLERIQANVAYMDSLTNDLLELSRIGHAVRPTEEIDTVALLREIQRGLALQLEEAGAELVVQGPMPFVQADPLHIRQVFTNLIDNAVKFRREDRPLRIQVGCKDETGYYRIHVADNGIGIALQYREKIFDPFRKLDQKTQGTGIGLALVKKIVESHGGRVWAGSPSTLLRPPTEPAGGREGVGVTFYFTLPRREES